MQNCGALTRSWYSHITDVASRSMEEPNATKFQRVEKTVRKTTTSRAATRTENYTVTPKYLLFHFQRSSYGTSASAKNSLCLEARYIFMATKNKMSLSLKYSLCLGERGILQKSVSAAPLNLREQSCYKIELPLIIIHATRQRTITLYCIRHHR